MWEALFLCLLDGGKTALSKDTIKISTGETQWNEILRAKLSSLLYHTLYYYKYPKDITKKGKHLMETHDTCNNSLLSEPFSKRNGWD